MAEVLPFSGMLVNGEIHELTEWSKRITLPRHSKAAGGVVEGEQPRSPEEVRNAAEKLSAALEGTTLWPTPTARDGMSGAGTSPKREGGMNLRTAVQRFPTPMARDWKSGTVSEATKNKNSRPLNEFVAESSGGQLNPVWVEWLMGHDGTWTEL